MASHAPVPTPKGVDPAATPAMWFDGVAIALSALCLVHCLALPLIAAALPALAPGGATHWVLLAVALPTSLWTLARGRGVAGLLPLAIGSAGLALMTLAVVVFEGLAADRWLTIAGVSLVAVAHLVRWHAQHRSHRHFATGQLVCAK